MALERNDIPVPDGFDKLTAPQIQNFIFNNSKSYEKLSAWRLSLKKGQTLIDEIIPRRFPRKDPIYYALWHLEETAGNPKIRADLNDRAHYEAFSNTMFIGGGTQKEIIEQFISESSHGVQVDSAPVTTAFRVLKDTVSQGAAALMHQESMHQVHDESAYDTPGTTEYEAHKIIQPQLEDQYKKDTKSYQIVAKNLNKNHGQPNQSAKAKTNSHRS